MKWILTFIGGALLGAIALFIYLRNVGADAPAPAPVVVTAPVQAPAAPPPAVGMPADLATAELPIRPSLDELPSVPTDSGINPEAGQKLLVPVEGIAASALTDTFDQARGSERKHEALDIMAPKGTRVLAATEGKVAKLFESKQGGLTVYQFDPAEKYAYYYAHLDRYAEGLKEGDVLKPGDLVGYVGVTGNSDPNGPHLHFAVFELTAEKQWWKGTPVNPYPLLTGAAPASAPAPASVPAPATTAAVR